MDHETINRLLDYWRRTFFIEPIVVLTFIFCFVVALLYHYRQRERILLLFYFFVGILLFIFSNPLLIKKIFSGREEVIAYEIANTTFELTEFIAFYFFFKQCLQSNKVKIVLTPFLISLCLVSASFFIALNFPNYTIENIKKHSLFINVIEFFFLFTMCLGYFYELFVYAPTATLSKRPSFLIVISAFFYSALMIPFFMLAYDIFRFETSTHDILFSFHFLLLIIMLITISKAFLCKTPITI